MLAALAAAALSACGGEDAELLPGETAREITANLDSVRQLADEGDCAGAEAAALQVTEQVEALTGVDRRLKEALRDGATRLNEVVAECEEDEEPETTTEPEEPETTEEEEPEKKPKKEKPEKEGGEGKPGKGPSEKVPPPFEEGEDDRGPSEEGGGPGEGNGTPSGGVSPGSAVEEGEG
jgi:outer membrane biosynthesis protein TonB